MFCKRCGRDSAFQDNPGQGLCLDCYRQADTEAAEAIDRATETMVDLVFQVLMTGLGNYRALLYVADKVVD